MRAMYSHSMTSPLFQNLPKFESFVYLSEFMTTSLAIVQCRSLRPVDPGSGRIRTIPNLHSLEFLGLLIVECWVWLPGASQLGSLDYSMNSRSCFSKLSLFPELELREDFLDGGFICVQGNGTD
jgi:hypothetical protein